MSHTSPATQSRWQWTWVWDDAVLHKYGAQLRVVGRGWSGQQQHVLSGMDGLLLLVVIGDGLLVYFGYPLAHEDDAQRAVRAGLGMVEQRDGADWPVHWLSGRDQ